MLALIKMQQKHLRDMVVVVARRDQWRSRAKENLNFLENLFDKQEKEGIDVKKEGILFREDTIKK